MNMKKYLRLPFKVFLQLEHSDCGVACVRMIANYYGRDLHLRTLREMMDVSRVGVSLSDILKCCRRLGLEAEAVKVSETECSRMPLPAILYWNQQHFVVLYRISRNGERFYVADPSRGKMVFSKSDFMHLWMGENSKGLAAVVDSTEAFYRLDFPKSEVAHRGLLTMFRRVTTDFHGCFVSAVAFTFVAVVADSIIPFLFQRTVDEAVGGHDIHLIWLLVCGQFMVYIGQYVANSISLVVLTKVGLRLGIRLVREYLDKLVALPFSFFQRKVSSDLIQKIEDQNRLRSFYVGLPDLVFFTFVNLLLFSVLLLCYSWQVYVLFVVASSLSFLWTRLFLRRRREIDYSTFSYAAENRNNIFELVNGIEEVAVNNARKARVEKWSVVQTKLNQLSLRSAYNNLSISSGNMFFARLRDIAVMGFSAVFVAKGQFSVGEMMTISYLVGRLAQPFSNLENAISSVQDAAMSYERLDEVMNAPCVQPKPSIAFPEDANIVLHNVSFRYPGSQSPLVLQGLNAIIERGKTTAIVGASGSGKSTLMKLLLGICIPSEGSVKVGTFDLKESDSDSWLKYCGVVMQTGQLFSGSIKENIALADESPDMDRVSEALRIACIYEFVESLPMGLNTRIGNCGLELSGGQRQRILIARAVYKNPQVLYLDEATSALDANNESSILDNLHRFSRGRTVVVAAHRMSTVCHADQILVLHKGKIVEHGTHHQLLAQQGFYCDLVHNQLTI